MSEAPQSTRHTMFNREVDFSLEVTHNAYEACRALSLRARDINSRFRHAATETTSTTGTPNPTVGAFSDYSTGRIVTRRAEVAEAGAEPA